MTESRRIDREVAHHLLQRRGQLTRRWLRAVRKQMHIRPVSRDAVVGLINQLPLLFDELCASVGEGAEEADTMRAGRDARRHGSERWRQGFALDELYLELDLLQRCVQACVREYFAGAQSRVSQAATHEAIERFFSDAIRGAIGQFQAHQDRRVNDAMGQRDLAVKRQRNSDERLRMAAEAAGLGIFEWDPETDGAVWENDRMYQITGQPRTEGALNIGDFIERVVHPDDAARVRSELKAALTSLLDFQTIFRIRRRSDGALRFLAASGRFMPASSGVGQILVGTLADVTQRVAADEATKEADRRKDIFLATLAHELRNPLAPILTAAHLLAKGSVPAAELRWIHDVVERHARHLAHLIDDLLDVSRITAGKIRLRKEVFNVWSAIDRAIEMNASAAAQRGHRLEVATSAQSALFVYGDLTRITQIVSNLLDNAIKYTNAGGDIRLAASASYSHVSITLQDNGMGMRPELIPSLFDLFEQASADGQPGKSGLGIGLSVARSLVSMHGGTITASSEGLGKGSIFTVSLPLCDAPVEVSAARVESDPVIPAVCKVLIVDDNEDAALSLAKILDDHDVRVATCGFEAVEIAREFGPKVVLLDLGLPDISGHEVATRLRKQQGGSDMLLVALTGYGQPEDRERTKATGFNHHLVKPVRIEEIFSILNCASKPDSL